jgi:hypothetical protein
MFAPTVVGAGLALKHVQELLNLGIDELEGHPDDGGVNGWFAAGGLPKKSSLTRKCALP